MDWMSSLQILSDMVNRCYVWMGCHDCHKYNGRGWIWSCMPPQLAINVQSSYAVHSPSTAAACCILPAVSLELSKHHTHIYIPPWLRCVWLCVSHNQWTPFPLREIRSYLYTRVQRN